MSASPLAAQSLRNDDELPDTLPLAVHRSLERHRENLASMMLALRAAGLDERSIEEHLSVLIDS